MGDDFRRFWVHPRRVLRDVVLQTFGERYLEAIQSLELPAVFGVVFCFLSFTTIHYRVPWCQALGTLTLRSLPLSLPPLPNPSRPRLLFRVSIV